MSWQHVRLADAVAMPWRNGGGTTRELLAWPSAADWQTRVSVAEVTQDGPFSRFEGIERWFAVLQGAGVRLVIDGEPHDVVASGAPLRFDGAAQTDATLIDGATQDFNLMARPGAATLRRVVPSLRRKSATLSLGAGTLVAVYDIPSAALAWQVTQVPVEIDVPADADALIVEVKL